MPRTYCTEPDDNHWQWLLSLTLLTRCILANSGAFYDACDEYGILLYHDLMFTGKAGSVRWSATVDAEVRYQIKRLSHHASIALWDACNECKVRDRRFTHHPPLTRPVCTRQIFYPWWKPVLPTVAAVDKSRPIWPASPSNGWTSGVERLTSRPTGSALAANSHWRAPGVGGYPWAQESHGPYTGFMRAAHASAPSADRCFV